MSFSVMLSQLAKGMTVTTEIFFVTLIFSLPLGLLVCWGKMSKIKIIRWIVSAYISIMRGTPLMLQLMVVYFGPYFIFGIRISMGYSLIAVFIAFAINYAAYFAEIYRGGIITLVKDTSLAFVVAVAEMFTLAKQIASSQTTMVPFVVAAVFYYVFNLLVAVIMDKVEKKLNYYR